MATQDNILHLWFKPYENVITESDLTFIERYGRRFYPKALGPVARELHMLFATLTRKSVPSKFEYQMTHVTDNSNGRYVIEEVLRDKEDQAGFSIGIQASTALERSLFNERIDQLDKGVKNKLSSVNNVVAYLEDTLDNEAHKWINASLANQLSVVTVLREIIIFLKNIRNHAVVYDFNVNEGEDGTSLSLSILTPNVMSYYTRIDWLIR